MSSQPPQDPSQPQNPGGYGTPQPPTPQQQNPGGYGTPQPPTPQQNPDGYGTPQYGSAPPPAGQQYGQAPPYASVPPPPDQGPGSPYATAGTTTQPQPIKQAVMLMRVGAVLSVLSLIAALATIGSIKDMVRQAGVDSGTPMSESTVNTAATAGLVAAVIFGLLGAGLWLWMASANGKGKKWARIVATVFFVVSVLSIVSNLAQGSTPALSLILGLVSLVLDAYIIFLLYKKESTAFYDGMAAARTPR